MDMRTIRPAKAETGQFLIVRNPYRAMAAVPDSGATVEWTDYWQRRLDNAEIELIKNKQEAN